jgi:hypothetical protein
MNLRTQVQVLDSLPTGIQIITLSGIYQLNVLLPKFSGNLFATFYSDAFFHHPLRNELSNVDFSSANAGSNPVKGKVDFSVKWSGLFKPTKSATYVTFKLSIFSQFLSCACG